MHAKLLVALVVGFLVDAPAFSAASIQITDPDDQEFVNVGGGAPAPVTVTYQITGNTCNGFRSSFAVRPYVNGVPVLCSGSGCSCDGTTENCNNITATVTLDGNDFGSCLNTIQLSLDPAPFTPILCITPGPAIFSGTIQVWQDPYKGCSGLGGGDGCNRPTVGGPVDVATGEMFYEVPDLLVVGPVAIEIRRRYESHSTFSGPLTTGWTHSYLMRIESAGTNRQVFIDEEGRSIYFSQNAQGGYGTNGIDQLTLTTPGSPTWRVTDKNQTRRDFDSSGRLTEIRDRNGNTLTFGYTGNNLTSITDIFGRSVTLTYDGSNRLQTIVAGTRTVTYTYVSGQLQRVDYPDSTFFTTAAKLVWGRIVRYA